MNTATTTTPVFSSFFSSKEDYLSFKAQWKVLANRRELTLEDAALRVLVLQQDAKKSLPVTQNPVRLQNGAYYASGLYRGMVALNYESRMAKRTLANILKGEEPKMSAFASRWATHGISLDAMAQLSELPSLTVVTGA